jgi:hypothetical protein
VTSFVDHASVKAVVRAQVETYLVFFYVFCSGNDSVAAYRHLTWKLGGLMDRLRLTGTTPESIAKLQSERQFADVMVDQLKLRPEFQSETMKLQKSLPKGEWKSEMMWQTLAEDAGLHATYFRNTYSFLCGYSHSSGASAMQILQA